METVDAVTLGAVTLCIVGTIECSKEVRRYPRLFTSLVYFALSWALLLPYYYLQANTPPPQAAPEQRELVEILAALSAILLMLTAGPLRAEAAGRRGNTRPAVDAIEVWAMRAVYIIAVPHALAFLPNVEDALRTRFVGIVHLVLAIAGFVLITRALWVLTTESTAWQRVLRGLRWVLLGVTTIYSAAYILFVYTILMPTATYTQMPDGYKWLFVPLKIAFCSVFLAMVLVIGRGAPQAQQQTNLVETNVAHV